MLIGVFVLALAWAFVGIHCEFVTVKNGLLKGTTARSKNGQAYRQFLGIPYAEPPIGDLRFQSPVPAKPWSGVRDASETPSVCAQPVKFNVINSPILGKEDCLYLNVHAPTLMRSALTSKIPVLVYIHGGAFQSGAGSNYSPDYLMDRNIIFVTLNYRLGALGFLGMNNDYIPGNFGMKDQALALKWVKENIEAFGGDPDNITIMGQSAGSASVHFHLFSPLSKGLFNKAIMQSGSAYAPWAYYDEPYPEALATTFIMTTGCFYKDLAKVLKCLRKVPAEALLQAESRLYVWDFDPTVLFRVTIESNVTNQPFLPHKPSRETYQTKNIPWIVGMTSGEGTFKALRYLSADGALVKLLDNDRNRLLPIINQYLYTAKPEHVDEITQKIIDYYFKNNTIGPDTDLKLVEMLTDSFFTYAFVNAVLSSDGPRYVYYYDHKDPYLSQSRLGIYNKDLGVSHSEEMPFIFRNEQSEAQWTPADKQISETLLNFWLNFAASSDPNGHSSEKTWKPVQSSAIEYLHIKNDGVVMEKDLLRDRYNFWDSLPLGRKNA